MKRRRQSLDHLRHRRDDGSGGGDGDDGGGVNGGGNHGHARLLLDMIHAHVHNLEDSSILHLFGTASHPHRSDCMQVDSPKGD